ncbi:MAG: acetyl-CoA carboxylase biotin carboxyl carrier protein subunit [Firmicutes bacterium]|nr:acetyl-CoA carboxylase biotin carboxyl carrier protein subunit [Bacillota bacterium]
MAAIASNMAGTVYKILVQVGQVVSVGDDTVILESMKMEVPVTAEVGGTVTRILVQEGDFVNDGDVVVELA